ncbi:MAG TPA: DUF5777 family beta-barrel protein [Balneolales bacterium]|nr:DUF5777 family beta-barrel protein [Balneolales bacterium]
MLRKYFRNLFIVLFVMAGTLAHNAYGQELTPHLAHVNKPVKAVFKAPTVVLANSVKNLYKSTLNMSIYHTFGLVSSGVKQFYGLDQGANVRLGLDYGITDNLSVGLSRTSIGKIVTARFKYSILHQMKDNSVPLELAMAGNASITTIQKPFKGSYTVGDRMSFMYELMAARKFSPKLSLQVAPIFAHYNRVYAGQKNNYFGVGLSGRYKLTGHTALAIEYIPEVNKAQGIYNTFSVDLNLETGGHVFQLFFTNAQDLTMQGMLRNTRNNFWAGDFRFGFNINRIFWFKDKPSDN